MTSDSMTPPEIAAAIAALERLQNCRHLDEFLVTQEGAAAALAGLKQWAERQETYWLIAEVLKHQCGGGTMFHSDGAISVAYRFPSKQHADRFQKALDTLNKPAPAKIGE